MYSIARNLCIDHIRRDKKIRYVSLERNDPPCGQTQTAPFKDRLCDAGQAVEFAYVKSRIFVCLNDCIARLDKDEDKQCLILYYLTGKVYHEIGDIFGKSISMIRKRIFAAREKVRFCLQRKGFDSVPRQNERPCTFG